MFTYTGDVSRSLLDTDNNESQQSLQTAHKDKVHRKTKQLIMSLYRDDSQLVDTSISGYNSTIDSSLFSTEGQRQDAMNISSVVNGSIDTTMKTSGMEPHTDVTTCDRSFVALGNET